MKLALTLLCLGILCCWSCNDAGSPAISSTPRAEDSFVKVSAYKVVDLGGASQIHLWDFHAEGIGELTLRLQLFKNGTREIFQESKYGWEEGTRMKGAWQVAFIEQSGEPFGQKGKIAPTLTSFFSENKPVTVASSTSTRLLPIIRTSNASSAITDSQFAGEDVDRVLYAIAAEPPSGNFSMPPDVSAMLKASKKGMDILAITVSWRPFKGQPQAKVSLSG